MIIIDYGAAMAGQPAIRSIPNRSHRRFEFAKSQAEDVGVNEILFRPTARSCKSRPAG